MFIDKNNKWLWFFIYHNSVMLCGINGLKVLLMSMNILMFEHLTDQEIMDNLDKIDRVWITKDLFSTIKAWIKNNGYQTTYFNQGKGIYRLYTLKFMLQITSIGRRDKYFITRDGRKPPQFGINVKTLELLQEETPNFDFVITDIIKCNYCSIANVQFTECHSKMIQNSVYREISSRI